MASFCHHKQYNGPGRGDRADRNAHRLQNKETHQQKQQHNPARFERRRIFYRAGGGLQQRNVIGRRDIPTKEQMQHHQRGGDCRKIHRDHDRSILRKAQAKEIRRDNVDQIGNNQRQAGSIGDKPCGHDKSQRRALAETQRQQHGNHNGRQDQCRTIVGK